MTTDEIVQAWPGVAPVVAALTANLTSVWAHPCQRDLGRRVPNFWHLTDFGVEFLEHLREARLDEELKGAREGSEDIGARIVAAAGEAGARELLDVLTRPDADRAALIGRLHQRADAE